MTFNEAVESIRTSMSEVEHCGLLLCDKEKFEVIRIRNTSKGTDSFVMDKFQYMIEVNNAKRANKSIVAVWHTHPTGYSDMSEKDKEVFSKSIYGMLIVGREGHTYHERTKQPI